MRRYCVDFRCYFIVFSTKTVTITTSEASCRAWKLWIQTHKNQRFATLTNSYTVLHASWELKLWTDLSLREMSRAYATDEFVNRWKSIPIEINRLILEIDEQSPRQDSVTFHRFPSTTERKQQSMKIDEISRQVYVTIDLSSIDLVFRWSIFIDYVCWESNTSDQLNQF